jgi:hypothetical protein
MQTIFSFLSNIRFSFHAACVLFVAALGFPPAHYRGVGVRLAGRCPAPAAVMLLGFCSGLDKLCSTLFVTFY